MIKNTEIDRHDLFSKLVEGRRLLRRLQSVILEIQNETKAPLCMDCAEASQAGAILSGHLKDLNEIAMKLFKK